MADIDKASWQAVSALLDELLEANAEQRAARLDELRARNPALSEHVALLLAQEAAIDTERFLERAPIDTSDLGSLAGRSIGGYTLERPLGRGGMGTVWLARRSDGRYEGQVAIKFLNLALLSRGGAERLRKEANALAKLAHPNITHLIDAGVAASGQPYLVLEYVAGEPIDRWCDQRALGVEARVRLFLQVLAAMSHAHGRLILHRDLKPSNILVTADGHVKLLDFGISKLLEQHGRTAPNTDLTGLGGAALTPEYAAPEQAQGSDDTTATDQYALGVLLYVLLTGEHPTASAGASPVERLQSLVDHEARRPSEVAPPLVTRALRGDLDNIVLKALKKLPAERYATIAAFAEDLERYLAHQPVNARADSGMYRAGKFLRRHRLAVAAASVAVLALIAGIIGTGWYAIEALKQRDRAAEMLNRREAVIEFVDMLFTQELPAEDARAIQTVLARGEQMIDTAFAGHPAQQADLLLVLASYYSGLSLPKQHLGVTERARALAGDTPNLSLRAEADCARAEGLLYVGREEEGLELMEPWLHDPRIEASAAAFCLRMRSHIAMQRSDSKAAVQLVELALQRLQASDLPHGRLEATLLGDLAYAYYLIGRSRDAERHYQLAYERMTELGRQESREARELYNDWGLVRCAMGDYKGGLEIFDRTLAIAQRSQGDAPIPPVLLTNRAHALDQLGRAEEALATYDQAYANAVKTGYALGKAQALNGKAQVLAKSGDLAGAQRSLDQAAPIVGTLPPEHGTHIRYTMVQARVDLDRGNLEAAHKSFSGVIALINKQGASIPPLSAAHRQRAEVEARLGNHSAALADAERALEIAAKLRGDNPYSDLSGLAALTMGRILRDTGEHERAQAMLRQAQEHLTNTIGAENPQTLAVLRFLEEG
jgi:tetratricopeptide (TPR) repeat protein